MKQRDIARLRALMAYEASRTEPPTGFPRLPPIPGARYFSAQFYQLEQERIWQRTWLLAAHMDEIPEPGCYRVWDLAGPPVLIAHGDDGTIRAFHNICRHRGSPVVADAAGRKSRFTCPYHGWSYNLDGELLAIRNPEDFRDFDYSDHGLAPIRCERFGRLVFVNFDGDAPALGDWLGPIAQEWQEFQFDRCRLAARHVFDLDCNWKIAMETNTEVYHVRSVHPKTVAPMLDDRRNVNTLYRNGHGRMVAPGREGSTVKAAVELPRGGNTIDTVGELARTCTQSYNIFPNWVSPLNHRTLAPLLFWPNGPGKCRLETWTLAPDWGDKPKPDMWTDNAGQSLKKVLLEDTEMAANIQKSVSSPGYTGVSLSYQEARIYHWHQSADRLIGIDSIPAALRVEQVIDEDWVYPNDPRPYAAHDRALD
jgi:phenylpropionate dioxygenase-like ring-hydroxylating dioxygenase large terminal subunit